MRQVEVVAAVYASWYDDAQGRLVRLHVPDLHGRGMRPQQRSDIVRATRFPLDRRREIEGVLHVARGMLGGHVERVEAVPVVFGFRPFDDGEAHAAENRFELVADDRQGMPVAEAGPPSGQRDVDGAGRPRGCLGVLGVRLPALLDRLLQLVRIAADVLFLLRSRGADGLHPRGDHAVLAPEVSVADGLRVADGRRRRKLALEVLDQENDGF